MAEEYKEKKTLLTLLGILLFPATDHRCKP